MNTIMSNRIQFAVHHDANVHLSPRNRLEALEVALVGDEARLRVCALGCAVGHRCRHGGFAGGGEYCENDGDYLEIDRKSRGNHNKNGGNHEPCTISLLSVEV